MVHKSFVNAMGPVSGQDDRTRLFYEKRHFEKLKELVDATEFTLYRDGNAQPDAGLDLLVRRIESPPDVTGVAAEVIPVKGTIAYIVSPWTKKTDKNYKVRYLPNTYCDVALGVDNTIQLVRFWLSLEAYKKVNPQVSLDLDNTVTEQIRKEPPLR